MRKWIGIPFLKDQIKEKIDHDKELSTNPRLSPNQQLKHSIRYEAFTEIYTFLKKMENYG